MNYILFKCSRCRYEFILPTEDYKDAKQEGREIHCPYCNGKNIKEEGKYSSLKECMDDVHVYRRQNGALKQIR